MNFFTTFFTALDALNSNKLRSGLTLLGIIIGVSAVITLMAIGRGAQESITSRIESLGTNLLFIRSGATNSFGFSGAQGSAANLTLEDSQALIDPMLAPSVVSVAPETQLRGQLVYQRENSNTRLIGITPEYLPVRSFEVEKGQSITSTHINMAAQVIILGPDVAEDLFGLREPVSQTIRVNGRDFEVIGVMKSKGSGGFGNQDDQAYVPISTAYYRLGTQRTPQGEISVQVVNVQVRDDDVTDAAVDEIRQCLVPVARRILLEELMDASSYYQRIARRRVTYEYTMLEGVNDSREQAKELIHLLRGQRCHLNLIPFNSYPGARYQGTTPDRIRDFRDIVGSGGVSVTIRRTRGRDISGACGQLHAGGLTKSIVGSDSSHRVE